MQNVAGMMNDILGWLRNSDDKNLVHAERSNNDTFWVAVSNLEEALGTRIIKRGISYLPKDCMAYRDGYRFAAYWEAVKGQPHIPYWFKTEAEIQPFVNEHREYSKEGR